VEISRGAPLTQLGTVMGTPGYMAPEQAVGQAVDERADVYALGVMLWECVAGSAPFTGDSLTEIIAKQFAAAPPALPPDAQTVPAGLAALLARMLESQPEQRIRSAVEVRDQLRALRLHGAIGETSREQGAASIAGLVALARAHASMLGPRVLIAAAGAVLLLVLLLISFSGPDQAPASAPQASPVQTRKVNREASKAAARPAERQAEAKSSAPEATSDSDPAEATQEEPRRSRKRTGKADRNSDSPKVGTRIKRSLDALFK
jgi:serine/threonine protein kinase